MSATVLIGFLAYIERAPLSYSARPINPALSNAARIFSPCGPYIVLRKCSRSRNRNGSDGIIDSGTIPWNAAVLTRTMSSAPIFTCSMVSFSEPSEVSPQTLMLYLPPVAFESSSPICFTATLVGKSLECTSARAGGHQTRIRTDRHELKALLDPLQRGFRRAVVNSGDQAMFLRLGKDAIDGLDDRRVDVVERRRAAERQ